MLTDEFTHEVNAFLKDQADLMLRKQQAINSAVYNERTGTLTRALNSSPSTGVDGQISVTVEFPKYIRFLDLKKGTNGKKKKHYAPIYNKYVYGYLKSALWKKISRIIPSFMIKQIDGTMTSLK